MNGKGTPEITVVICTYNRSAMLSRAVESVLNQTLPASSYEVVVVDNASTDDTQAVVEELSANNPDVCLSLVKETQQGLGYARNRGLRVARASYVAYLDDDAVATGNWLEAALECVHDMAPSPAAVGGPILPLYENEKPRWFSDDYETRSHGNTARYLNDDEYLSGSNMILDKHIVQLLGGFAEDVGMHGEFVSLGEETVLFRRMRSSSETSHLLFYSPDIVVRHSVPASRMTISSRLRRYIVAGYEDTSERGTRKRSATRELAATLVGGIRMAIAAIPRRRDYPHWQNWVVEEYGPVAAQYGKIARLLHIPVRVRR